MPTNIYLLLRIFQDIVEFKFKNHINILNSLLLSMQAQNDLLFEYFDENMENGWTVSVEEYVENWKNNIPYGVV